MKSVRGIVAAAVSVLVIAVPLAIGTAGAAGASAPAKSGAKAKVAVGDNFFKPIDIEVVAGTKVVWTNRGKILHNVTPDKGKTFGTKKLGSGASYSYTFKKPGAYAYHCSFHGAPGSGQYGTITVTAAPTPTATTAVRPAG